VRSSSCGFTPSARAVTFSATLAMPDCIECAYTWSTSVERACPIMRATLNALSPAVRPRLARFLSGAQMSRRTFDGFIGVPVRSTEHGVVPARAFLVRRDTQRAPRRDRRTHRGSSAGPSSQAGRRTGNEARP
jgi:hypothetical protein